MMGRLVAWAVVLAFCGVIWQYGSRWHSPWALPSATVLNSLPPAHTGCTDNCK